MIGFSYPVVPKGEARIRVQLSAGHTEAQVDRAVENVPGGSGRRWGWWAHRAIAFLSWALFLLSGPGCGGGDASRPAPANAAAAAPTATPPVPPAPSSNPDADAVEAARPSLRACHEKARGANSALRPDDRDAVLAASTPRGTSRPWTSSTSTSSTTPRSNACATRPSRSRCRRGTTQGRGAGDVRHEVRNAGTGTW